MPNWRAVVSSNAESADREFVAAASAEIEALLTESLGATGRGLPEKITCVEEQLPEKVVEALREIATVQMQMTHTHNRRLDDRKAFEDTFCGAAVALETMLHSAKANLDILSQLSAELELQLATSFPHVAASTSAGHLSEKAIALQEQMSFKFPELAYHLKHAAQKCDSLLHSRTHCGDLLDCDTLIADMKDIIASLRASTRQKTYIGVSMGVAMTLLAIFVAYIKLK